MVKHRQNVKDDSKNIKHNYTKIWLFVGILFFVGVIVFFAGYIVASQQVVVGKGGFQQTGIKPVEIPGGLLENIGKIGETICNDLLDNDNDSLMNCADPECAGKQDIYENICCRTDDDCLSGGACLEHSCETSEQCLKRCKQEKDFCEGNSPIPLVCNIQFTGCSEKCPTAALSSEVPSGTVVSGLNCKDKTNLLNSMCLGQDCDVNKKVIWSYILPTENSLMSAGTVPGRFGCCASNQIININKECKDYDIYYDGIHICGENNNWIKCVTETKGNISSGKKWYCDGTKWVAVPTCTPQCTDKTCGDDGCGGGGSCGTCGANRECNAAGKCVQKCIPSCTSKNCGDNGCDGSCGTCSADQTCTAGTCGATTVTKIFGDVNGDNCLTEAEFNDFSYDWINNVNNIQSTVTDAIFNDYQYNYINNVEAIQCK